MNDQKHLFQLPDDIHYLNGAYMSPLLKSVEQAGIEGIMRKRNPMTIKADDFFDDSDKVRALFAKLVNCNAQQTAIIPSASYGITSAVKNIPVNNGSTALLVSEEFPSAFYALKKWCSVNNKKLKAINAPGSREKRAEEWNKNILDAIDDDTSVVALSSIHWTDGTLFNLKEIGEKCKKHNAMFIVDGSQSVGALPIDVTDFQIDALVCASYKWLMGPYSIGLAYYSEYFNSGTPLEETWMNKINARDFPRLTDYTDDYYPGAARFNVGEYGNFILLPMMYKALEQILEWKTDAIQEYCDKLTQPLTAYLKENDFWIEEKNYRSKHLFGFLSPPELNLEELLGKLRERKISVSVRGKSVRVSSHLYNTKNDIDALIETLDELKKSRG